MKEYYFTMQKKTWPFVMGGKIIEIDKEKGKMVVDGFKWDEGGKPRLEFKTFNVSSYIYDGPDKDKEYEEYDVDKDVYIRQSIKYIFEEIN